MSGGKEKPFRQITSLHIFHFHNYVKSYIKLKQGFHSEVCQINYLDEDKEQKRAKSKFGSMQTVVGLLTHETHGEKIIKSRCNIDIIMILKLAGVNRKF